MLGARGVALGLGKINLHDLNAASLPAGRRREAAVSQQQQKKKKARRRRMAAAAAAAGDVEAQLEADKLAAGDDDDDDDSLKPKIIVKKHVDKQVDIKSLTQVTFWAACRAVVFGTALIVLGTVMTVLGYFSTELSTVYNSTLLEAAGSLDGDPLASAMRTSDPSQTETATFEAMRIDRAKKIQFDSLSFIGPVVMGVGAFILMIACVMTLENRDKHAQIVHEFPNESKSRRKHQRRKQSKLRHSHHDKKSRDGQEEKEEEHQRQQQENNKAPARPNQLAKSSSERPLAAGDDERRLGTNRDRFAGATRIPYGPAETTDSQPTTTLTTTASSVRPNEAGGGQKYASSSCIDSLVSSAGGDSRALIQRLLDDQSRMAATAAGKNDDDNNNNSNRVPSAVVRDEQPQVARVKLFKQQQSNSVDVPPTAQKATPPKRAIKSDELPTKQRIVAEVHQEPPASSAEPAPTKQRQLSTVTVRKATGIGRRRPSGTAPLVPADVDEEVEEEQLFTSRTSLTTDRTPNRNETVGQKRSAANERENKHAAALHTTQARQK